MKNQSHGISFDIHGVWVGCTAERSEQRQCLLDDSSTPHIQTANTLAHNTREARIKTTQPFEEHPEGLTRANTFWTPTLCGQSWMKRYFASMSIRRTKWESAFEKIPDIIPCSVPYQRILLESDRVEEISGKI